MSFREEQLDNPAWWALRDHHAGFAVASGDGVAVRYQADVSLFGAVDVVDGESWAALRALTAPGGVVGLFRAAVGPVPASWTEVYRAAVVQMIAPPITEQELVADVVALDAGDAADMFALARETNPGPFEVRTHQLGRFVGVRRNGRLVAMAGERFRLPGATEISAVCTAERARRVGLGAAVTLEVARAIQARGDVALLHVESTNESAYRLYQSMGFTARREVEVVAAVRD